MEILKLIFSVPGAVIIVSILAFIVIMTRLESLRNFKFKFWKKDKEIGFESQTEDTKLEDDKLTSEISSSLPETKKEEITKGVIIETLEDEKGQNIDKIQVVYDNKDIKTFNELMDILIEQSNQKRKPFLISFKLKMKYLLDDEKALEELKKLASKDDDLSYEARTQLVEIHKKLDDYVEAKYFINKNIEASRTHEEKHRFNLELLDLLLEIKDIDETEKLLKNLYPKCQNKKEKAEILERFGDLSKKKNYKNFSFIYHEKSLEIYPYNNSLRFQHAYACNKAGLNELAIYHYLILNSQNYDRGLVSNNLGVSYDEMEMPIHAIDFFKKSFKENESLAASNLGKTYLIAGFRDDAKNILELGLKFELVEDYVHSSLALVEKKLKDEDDKEKEILNLSKAKRDFFIKISNSFEYESKISKEILKGVWNTSLGDIQFSSDDGISGLLEQKGKKVSLRGNLVDSICELDWKFIHPSGESGECFLVFTKEGDKFEGILFNFPDELEFKTFSGEKKET